METALSHESTALVSVPPLITGSLDATEFHQAIQEILKYTSGVYPNCRLSEGSAEIFVSCDIHITLSIYSLSLSGEVVVNLRELAKALPEKGEVKLRVEGEALTIKNWTSIVRFDPAEWPVAPEIGQEDGDPFLLPATVKQIYQMSARKEGDHLDCLNVDFSRGEVMATDGHRLSWAALDSSVPRSAQTRKIPGTAIAVLKEGYVFCQFFTRREKTVEGKEREPEHFVMLSSESMTIIAKCIDWEIPDYVQVINQSRPRKVSINRKALLEALAACKKRHGKNLRGIRFDGMADRLKVTATHGGETCETTIPAEGAAGLIFGIDIRYLLPVAKLSTDMQLVVWMSENDPDMGCVKDSMLFEGKFPTIIMPMRIF